MVHVCKYTIVPWMLWEMLFLFFLYESEDLIEGFSGRNLEANAFVQSSLLKGEVRWRDVFFDGVSGCVLGFFLEVGRG